MDVKCLRPTDDTWTSFSRLLKKGLELHTKGMSGAGKPIAKVQSCTMGRNVHDDFRACV